MYLRDEIYLDFGYGEKNMQKYMFLKRELINYIENQEMRPGSLMPSESDLMETYNLSRITVRRAIEELKSEGQVYKIQGKGTFVGFPQADGMKISECQSGYFDEIEERGMTAKRNLLTTGLVKCDKTLFDRFGVTEGSVYFNYERYYTANGIPTLYVNDYYKSELVKGIELCDLEHLSIASYLKEKIDFFKNSKTIVLDAVIAAGKIKDIFGFSQREALLHAKSKTIGIYKENPYEVLQFGDAYYRTDIIPITV